MKFSFLARFIFALCLFLTLEAHAETPSQIPNPLQTGGSWVSDNARIISDADKRRINNLLSPLERKTKSQVTVVTVKSLDGMTVEQFAVDLARRWRVGRTGKDNGVLILVAMKEQKSRIETGYGIEPILPDGKAGEIVAQNLKPAFKNGAYGEGLYATALAVAQIIDPGVTSPAEGSPVSPPSLERPVGPSNSDFPVTVYPASGGGLLIALLGLLSLLFPFLLFGGMIWFFTAAMRRPLRCSKCRAPVQQLSDKAELPSLSPVQQFEQQIGARDYRVWHCQKCGNEDITAHDLPYSQFVQCPTCRHQTASALVENLRYPTPFQGGLQRVILSCQWPECKHSSYYNRPTPPAPRGAYGGGYSRGYGGGTDLLTGIVLGSMLGNSHQSGGWGSGGGTSGGDSGGSSGDFGGGGFDSGPSDFGGGDFGGGGASGDW